MLSLERMEINQVGAGSSEQVVGIPAPQEVGPVAGANVALPVDTIKPVADAPALPIVGSVAMSLDGPSQVKVGTPFTVQIKLHASGLQNALVDLSYDAAKLKVLNVTEGDLLSKPDGKTQFMQQVQDKSGRINLGVTRKGNVQGDGILASVTFQPLDSASGQLQLRVGAANFSDAAGRVLPVSSLPVSSISIGK